MFLMRNSWAVRKWDPQVSYCQSESSSDQKKNKHEELKHTIIIFIHLNLMPFFYIHIDDGRVDVVINLRILIHPFTQQCSPQTREHIADLEIMLCSQLNPHHSCCESQIFNMARMSCVDRCPEPLVWTNGVCEHQSRHLLKYHSNPTCSLYPERMNVEEYRNLRNESVQFTRDSLIILLRNETICFNCSWIQYPSYMIVHSDHMISIIESGEEFFWPFFIKETFDSQNSSYSVCSDPAAAVRGGLLGAACAAVSEETTSVVTTSISIACLVVLIIVYCVIPALRNTPGYMVLSQVRQLCIMSGSIYLIHHFRCSVLDAMLIKLNMLTYVTNIE